MKYYLVPNNGRKSFYNKAVVDVAQDGSKTLYSYNTMVASYDSNGQFHRLWNGYSLTTMAHVKAFTNNAVASKAQWEAIAVE